ncbi:unnamed protein product [Paramecium pentaurelia]|uniref:Transmembrane protein n=1 Tax=Paramecium pentaurelia TaxID=43138 RepID=A0A8S1YJB7_9CILI|nr:unnamed protein product [Paramecium pentaurelia]
MKLAQLMDILKLYIVFNLVRIAIVFYLPVLIILFDVGNKLIKNNGRVLNLIYSILIAQIAQFQINLKINLFLEEEIIQSKFGKQILLIINQPIFIHQTNIKGTFIVYAQINMKILWFLVARISSQQFGNKIINNNGNLNMKLMSLLDRFKNYLIQLKQQYKIIILQLLGIKKRVIKELDLVNQQNQHKLSGILLTSPSKTYSTSQDGDNSVLCHEQGYQGQGHRIYIN